MGWIRRARHVWVTLALTRSEGWAIAGWAVVCLGSPEIRFRWFELNGILMLVSTMVIVFGALYTDRLEKRWRRKDEARRPREQGGDD